MSFETMNSNNEKKRVYEGVSDITIERFRAGGKGGQNVNKVETAVRLRAKISDPKLFARLLEIFPGSVTDNEEFLVEARTERSQWQNEQRAYALFEHRLHKARQIPKERFETKPTKGSQECRITKKKQRSETKEQRRKNFEE